ncbi:MAG: ABC transporter substrate-binding protein [Alphaproteobacteria bacterium]|nr:ABC transporter substrate-binding protein [Alphaproteobacteria bacterium]
MGPTDRYGAKFTRRRLLRAAAAGGTVGLGAVILPAPWRTAFGEAKPYKLGTVQPLTGVAAYGGKSSLVGVQMAVDRINKAGGILGRPVELIVGDDESKPDVGRRAVEKLATEDNIDFHVGGFLSNICLACTPVWEEHKIVNMIGVCLDTTLTTTKCSRYTFRTFDFAPAQAKAFAPYLVNQIGKKWHILYADYSWGQSTRDAYAAEIKTNGGAVVGSTGIPLGTADTTSFLSKIGGDFDGIFLIFFGSDAINVVNQGTDLGLAKKYKFAGDGAVATSTQLPAMGSKIEGFVGIDRYLPVFDPPLDTPELHGFFDEALARMKKVDPSGPLPDRYIQSNFEAVNALKLGIEKSGFQGRADTPKLIEALEGLKMEAGPAFPTGEKVLRKDDHQVFMRELIYVIKDGTYHMQQAVAWDQTLVPPACRFPAA